MFFYIRLQVSCPGLPIVRRVADTARQKDELIRVRRRKNQILGVAPDHAKPIDEHSDEQIGLSKVLTVVSADDTGFYESREGLHGVWRAQDRVSVTMHELEILDGIFDVDDASRTEFGIDRSTFDKLFELLTA